MGGHGWQHWDQGILGQGLLLCGEVYARHHSNLNTTGPTVRLPPPSLPAPSKIPQLVLLGSLEPQTGSSHQCPHLYQVLSWVSLAGVVAAIFTLGGSTSGCTLGK